MLSRAKTVVGEQFFFPYLVYTDYYVTINRFVRRSSCLIALLLFTCVGNLEKKKKVAGAIPLGWPGLIGKCRFIFLGFVIMKAFHPS